MADSSYELFVSINVFVPIVKTCRKLVNDYIVVVIIIIIVVVIIFVVVFRTNTHVIVVPSQRDVSHQWTVYPQPPFSFDKEIMKSVNQ